MRHALFWSTISLALLWSTYTAAQRMGEDFGSHVVYANAVLTDTLAPQAAKQHGITRSKQRGLLNVSVEKKTGERPFPSVRAQINVQATNLAGQLKEVEVREVDSGDYVYYIGTFSVAPRETVNFDIEVIPEDSGKPLRLQFERRFLTAENPGN